MTKILINGILGHMGRAICAAAEDQHDLEIAGGIDRLADPSFPYPVFSSPEEVNVPFDVIVDFSSPSALERNVCFALEKNVPLLVGTTGLSDEQADLLVRASEKIPVFRSANMSVGVNLQTALVRAAAETLGAGFDIEIVERHHRLKVDAPSGTALMLAEAAAEGSGRNMEYVYERHSKREKRTSDEIGIHSVRGGTIVGEHEVAFIGNDEIITITHQAFSKRVFAEGTLRAARYLAGRGPGLYSMRDVIG